MVILLADGVHRDIGGNAAVPSKKKTHQALVVPIVAFIACASASAGLLQAGSDFLFL